MAKQDPVLKEAMELWEWFAKFRKTRREWRRVRDREWSPNIGKMYHDTGPRFKSDRPQDASNRYEAVLGTIAPGAYTVRARTLQESEREGAQKTETWLNVLGPILQRGPWGQMSPVELGRSFRVSDGVDVRNWDLFQEWLDLKDKADKEDLRLRMGLPFGETARDPLHCAWFHDRDGLATVVHRARYQRNPLAALFEGENFSVDDLRSLGRGQDPESASGERNTVLLTEVQKRETIQYYMEEVSGGGDPRLLRTVENPWRRPAFQIIGARIQAGDPDPDKVYQPLIALTLELSKTESHLKTLVLLAAQLTAAPCYDLFIEKGAQETLYFDPDTKKPVRIELDPEGGIAQELPPGSYLKQRTIEVGVDVLTMIEMVDARLNEVGFPTGLTGETPQPRVPAWSAAQASEKGMLQIAGAIKNEEAAGVESAQMLTGIIKNYIGEEVPLLTVGANEGDKPSIVTLGPNDVGEYDITCELTVPNTSIMLAKLEFVRQAVAEGTLPKEFEIEEAMKMLGRIPDVEGVKDKIMRERIDAIADIFAYQDILEETQRQRAAEGKPPMAPPEMPAPPRREGPGRPTPGEIRPAMTAAEYQPIGRPVE